MEKKIFSLVGQIVDLEITDLIDMVMEFFAYLK